VGWGQLKDGLKLAWMLGFLFNIGVSFPGLFPGFAFDTSDSQLCSPAIP
jgi:hypothetical protein